MTNLASQAALCYNSRNIVRPDDTRIPSGQKHNLSRLIQRSCYEYDSTLILQLLQLFSCFPLDEWRKVTMPAPKDPKRAAELRIEISERNTGYKHTPDAIEQIRQANYNRDYKPHTQEAKDKISAANRGRPSPKRITRYCKNCNAPYFGRKCKKYCSEACRKEANQGRTISEWHKEQIRAGSIRANATYWTDERRAKNGDHNRGREWSPEFKTKVSEGVKAFYDSMTEEERAEYHAKRIASQRCKNTSIEVFVAQWLDAHEVRYEQQKRIGHYFVDFYLTDIQLLLEINGCWWHACEECGCNTTEYSAQKRVKDAKRIAYLESKGYTVAVLWEHDLLPFMDKHKGT